MEKSTLEADSFAGPSDQDDTVLLRYTRRDLKNMILEVLEEADARLEQKVLPKGENRFALALTEAFSFVGTLVLLGWLMSGDQGEFDPRATIAALIASVGWAALVKRAKRFDLEEVQTRGMGSYYFSIVYRSVKLALIALIIVSVITFLVERF